VAGGLASLYRTCELDGAAEQEELLRQCSLAGVRVRDDREGAAAGNFVLQRWHRVFGRRFEARDCTGASDSARTKPLEVEVDYREVGSVGPSTSL
jgi:hypothetical protein